MAAQQTNFGRLHLNSTILKWAEGSVLAKFGDTHVLCNVTVDERVPRWLHQSESKHGWVTAEYAMLPRSTNDRLQRSSAGRKGERWKYRG